MESQTLHRFAEQHVRNGFIAKASEIELFLFSIHLSFSLPLLPSHTTTPSSVHYTGVRDSGPPIGHHRGLQLGVPFRLPPQSLCQDSTLAVLFELVRLSNQQLSGHWC